MKLKFKVEEEIRIDKFLSNHLTEFSRTKIQEFIEKGFIEVNKVKITDSKHKLKNSGQIEIKIKKSKPETTIKPWNKKNLINIIFENKDYLVINKPKNLIVHPGNGNKDKTLVNILSSMDVKLANEFTNRPGIAHRLDKNTTGVMIISKNDTFLKHFQEQISNQLVEKKYLGLTVGNLKNKKILVETPIGRHKTKRTLMDVVSTGGKDSKTIFEVKERFLNHDLVEFTLLTGRMHQIRVHSKFLGTPIFNDPQYGKEEIKDYGQFLHSHSISFLDLEGNKVIYDAPLPKEFENKIVELRRYNNKDKNVKN